MDKQADRQEEESGREASEKEAQNYYVCKLVAYISRCSLKV